MIYNGLVISKYDDIIHFAKRETWPEELAERALNEPSSEDSLEFIGSSNQFNV